MLRQVLHIKKEGVKTAPPYQRVSENCFLPAVQPNLWRICTKSGRTAMYSGLFCGKELSSLKHFRCSLNTALLLFFMPYSVCGFSPFNHYAVMTGYKKFLYNTPPSFVTETRVFFTSSNIPIEAKPNSLYTKYIFKASLVLYII